MFAKSLQQDEHKIVGNQCRHLKEQQKIEPNNLETQKIKINYLGKKYLKVYKEQTINLPTLGSEFGEVAFAFESLFTPYSFKQSEQTK